MGITKQSYDSIISTIDNIEDKNNKTVLELGIQESYFDADFKFLRNKISNFFKSYISIDLHNIEGVTIYDLSQYNQLAFSADLISNIGTSEHVEYEEGQYNCWKNIHNWLNLGGICIHELPEVGSWKNHCRYYCDFEFFENFINYGYEIIEIRHHLHIGQGNLIWCVMRKKESMDFMSFDEFYSKMKIDREVTSDKIDYRNNPKNLKI
jgi:hypothetical protein